MKGNKVNFIPANAILLIGPTGSGKTPLGNYIEEYGFNGKRCFHFDFGHELRSIAGIDPPPHGFDKDDHAFIRGVLEKGLLLENEHFHIAEKIVEYFLNRKGFRDDDMLLLNGLPRHIDQAQDVARVADIRKLIVLECSPDDIFGRILGNTGGDRTERTDDSIGMVRKKLDIFERRTKPLIDYYSKINSKIFRIKVTTTSTAENLYSGLISIPGIF